MYNLGGETHFMKPFGSWLKVKRLESRLNADMEEVILVATKSDNIGYQTGK